MKIPGGRCSTIASWDYTGHGGDAAPSARRPALSGMCSGRERRDCKYKHDRAHGPLAHGRLGCLVFGHVLGSFSCKVPIFEDPFVVGMLSLLSIGPKYEVFCMGMLVLILNKIMFSFCV